MSCHVFILVSCDPTSCFLLSQVLYTVYIYFMTHIHDISQVNYMDHVVYSPVPVMCSGLHQGNK